MKALGRITLLSALVLLILTVSCTENSTPDEDYCYSLEMNGKGEIHASGKDWVITLEKKKGEDFTILNLTDFQIEHPSEDAEFRQVIDYLVESVEPDLITITGDLSYGKAATLEEIGEILESYSIPWAPVFGNHDHNEIETKIEEQCRILDSFPHCLFRTGPDMGMTNSGKSMRAGNYVINIVEKEGNGFSVVKTLVFLDTGDETTYSADDNKGKKEYRNGYNWDHLTSDQVEFYNDSVQSASRYSGNSDQGAILFIHMPVFAYADAIDAALGTDISIYDEDAFIEYAKTISYENSLTDRSLWTKGYKDSSGVCHEKIGCAPYDDGVFDNIKDNTDTIICGHEHINNFIVDYRSVRFCYATKTGKGCYYEAPLNGGTVVTVSDNGETEVFHLLAGL